MERFAGDEQPRAFQRPLPCPDPARRAVLMSIEMRGDLKSEGKKWQATGHELGFGISIATATQRSAASGSRADFNTPATGTGQSASRLCDQASDGQILVDAKVCASVGHYFELQQVGELTL